MPDITDAPAIAVNESTTSPVSTAAMMDGLPVCLTCSETLVQTTTVFKKKIRLNKQMFSCTTAVKFLLFF